MKDEKRKIVCIDLKSFYASVECAERKLDPLTTNLVVADVSRTEKTICLAVSPSLKTYGITGRPRLFEVIQKVRDINNYRQSKIPSRRFIGKSWNDTELKAHTDWELDYVAATPRMALYIEYSARIYNIYLKYIAPEDIHVYSIDEVFMDVTDYLKSYGMTAHELAMKMIHDILDETGITATAGIGSNMYLGKVAMDVVAKHVPADKDGVRIAELDEMSYRKNLWNHEPLTSFWRVGRGIAEKLAVHGITTMGQIARMSVDNEELFYRLFGVNAELLIDHAWGWEPCTMREIKAYRPLVNSMSNGQVLQCAYTFKKGRVVIKEMAESIAMTLLEKHLVTEQVVLTIGFDAESLKNNDAGTEYHGQVTTDWYGRLVPKHAHGSTNLRMFTSSIKLITDAVVSLYENIVNPNLLIRRINITANNVMSEEQARLKSQVPVELDMFTDYEALFEKKMAEENALAKERRMQETLLDIKKKFGKNAILRGLNYEDGATAVYRNKQIGGHKA